MTATAADMDTTGIDTVLIVEDDIAVRQVMCRGMQARGYLVLEANNGEDALQVADRFCGPIHLVISDVVMPTMNGRQLFAHLRGWYPAIRFLFVSGYSDGPGADIPTNGAHTGFLAKPFTVAALACEARRLLDTAVPVTSPFGTSEP